MWQEVGPVVDVDGDDPDAYAALIAAQVKKFKVQKIAAIAAEVGGCPTTHSLSAAP
jgi:hypothetical protein